MQLIRFPHGQELVCLQISELSEVLDDAECVLLPRLPAEFDGLFQLRGRVITLLNFQRCFGGARADSGSEIIVFAEPRNHFAIRVPGQVETVEPHPDQTEPFDADSKIGSITDSILREGEKTYRLLSAKKILWFASQLVLMSSKAYLRFGKGMEA
jgi:chemotaxis signal transduction protein